MATDSPVNSAAVCPRCRAAVRGGAPWCGQCYLDLRAAPAPVAAPREPAGPAGWPCTVCGARNDLHEQSCAACGAAFLAGLSEPRPALVLPLVGDVAALSTVQRFALAAVGALVLALLVLVAVTGVGLVV